MAQQNVTCVKTDLAIRHKLTTGS